MSDIFETDPNSFDAFSTTLDTTGVTQDDFHGGGGVQKEGFYHIHVASVQRVEEDGKMPHIKAQFQVLAGEHESEVNKSLWHRIYPAKWADERKTQLAALDPSDEKDKRKIAGLLNFAWSFGLVRGEDIGKPGLKIPWNLLDGRQAVCKVKLGDAREVEQQDGTKKTYSASYGVQWNSDFWPVFDEHVKDVPKDPDALAALRASGITPESFGGGAGGGTSASGSGASTAKLADADLDDI